MQVQELRNYGVAFSDSEAGWPQELKSELSRKARRIVFGNLSFWQKASFAMAFLRARRRARSVELSGVLARGLDTPAFLAQQTDLLCIFRALAEVLDTERAVKVMEQVMEATADALLLCLPAAQDLLSFDDPFQAVREYMACGPEVGAAAGCHEMTWVEDGPDRFGFDVTWCVWLELARAHGVEEACGPNCYADDLVFPEYFSRLGIDYQRTETLGTGGCRCDFRFQRIKEGPAGAPAPRSPSCSSSP